MTWSVVDTAVDSGSLYCEVEKRKKGEVSLKAATYCRARAAAHNLRVAIVDESCGMGMVSRWSFSDLSLNRDAIFDHVGKAPRNVQPYHNQSTTRRIIYTLCIGRF